MLPNPQDFRRWLRCPGNIVPAKGKPGGGCTVSSGASLWLPVAQNRDPVVLPFVTLPDVRPLYGQTHATERSRTLCPAQGQVTHLGRAVGVTSLLF